MSVRQQSFESVQRGQQDSMRPAQALTKYRRWRLELVELIRGATNVCGGSRRGRLADALPGAVTRLAELLGMA